MRLIKSGENLLLVLRFAQMADRLGSKRFQTELYRGVVDAGRKTKTVVQRTVAKQMALKSGKYQSYVVANTRGVGRKEILAFDIFSMRGGAKADHYRGLKSVGRKKSRLSKNVGERGTVQSDMWNNRRIFKRSFEVNGKFYMMRSAEEGVKAPRVLWTRDDRSWQPRNSKGQFGQTGAKYGKVRQLYGPALRDELVEDDSANIFAAIGPRFLEDAVSKRVEKLMRF